MRIGVDARPLAVRSGIGRYTGELLSRMIQKSPHEYFLYSNVEPDLKETRFRSRVPPIRSPRSSSFLAQVLYPRWARQDRLDVFWSPRHHLPRLPGIAKVVTIHDLVWRKAPWTMRPLGRLLERMLMPTALEVADRIIAISQSTRSDLIEYRASLATKICVIPGAPFVQPGEDEHVDAAQDHILFVGTFEPRKNIDGILKAYKLLLGRMSDAPPLVLAGQPGWKTDVNAMIRNLNIGDRVVIENSPDDTRLMELYRAADFLVMPSHYEGFGLPLLESMAFGKPAITANLSSMPEVVGACGLCVDPLDHVQLATAMETLLTNRCLRNSLGRLGLARARDFSWDRAAIATTAILEESPGRRSRG